MFGIDQSPVREAAFLAQVAHETSELRFMRELASGAAYDTGQLAKQLGNTPEADGDGQFYKGRGLIQVTGRANYAACSLAMYGDDRLLNSPELLEQPYGAAVSAAWFWQSNGLNPLADSGEFERITRIINGGTNGQAQRIMYWARAKKTLGLA